jgi:phosphoglycerate dehydrogenase-like enzyme
MLLLVERPDYEIVARAYGSRATFQPFDASDTDGTLERAEAWIGRFPGLHFPDVMARASRLRWIHSCYSGVESLLCAALVDSEVVLTNARGVAADAVADHAFALLLSLTRLRRPHPIELSGKVAAIVGMGCIGRAISARATAFGMTVVGIDPTAGAAIPPSRYRAVTLEEGLRAADVIFLALPLTPISRNLLGHNQFALVKRGALFIAVSRGRVYDLEALTAALAAGVVGAAGLDVTHPARLPDGSPLLAFENVIVTDHIAGRSDRTEARGRDLLLDNVRRFLEGSPLLNVVDKRRGY